MEKELALLSDEELVNEFSFSTELVRWERLDPRQGRETALAVYIKRLDAVKAELMKRLQKGGHVCQCLK